MNRTIIAIALFVVTISCVSSAQDNIAKEVERTTETQCLYNSDWRTLSKDKNVIMKAIISISNDIAESLKYNSEYFVNDPRVFPLHDPVKETLLINISLGGKLDSTWLVFFFKEDENVKFQVFDTIYFSMDKNIKDINSDGQVEIIFWSVFTSTSNANQVFMPIIYGFNGEQFVEDSKSYKSYYEKYLSEINQSIKDTESMTTESLCIDEDNDVRWRREHHVSDLIVCQSYAESILGKNISCIDKVENWSVTKDRDLKRNIIRIYAHTKDKRIKPMVDNLSKDKDKTLSDIAQYVIEKNDVK
jgi:hypothetical protein